MKTRNSGVWTMLAGFALIALFNSTTLQAAEQIIPVTTSRSPVACATGPISDVTLNYLLVDAPVGTQAKGVLLMFVGGGGKLDIADSQLNISANNFLLRSRYLFAGQGFHVAVMDAASDFLTCNRGLRNRRTSAEFTADMQSIVDNLRERFDGLPIWLVGTSRGSTAAAQGAATISPVVNGLVLTSSVTNPVTLTVFNTPLGSITQPTLIAYHEDDACSVSPPAGNEFLQQALTSASKVKVYEFDGGLPSLSMNTCDAVTPHGFLGIEGRVVKKISRWITRQIKHDGV